MRAKWSMLFGPESGQCYLDQKGQSYCGQKGQFFLAKGVKFVWLFHLTSFCRHIRVSIEKHQIGIDYIFDTTELNRK